MTERLLVSFAEPHVALREAQVDARTTVVSVAGEIHVSTAPEFGRRVTEIVQTRGGDLVLDLSAVTFIDSTGLSVLLNALRAVTRQGGRLALACANPTVLRLFEITHLNTTFALHPTLGAAVADVQSAGGSDAGAP
jgi:anti-sigma B factor antagonist